MRRCAVGLRALQIQFQKLKQQFQPSAEAGAPATSSRQTREIARDVAKKPIEARAGPSTTSKASSAGGVRLSAEAARAPSSRAHRNRLELGFCARHHSDLSKASYCGCGPTQNQIIVSSSSSPTALQSRSTRTE